MLKILVFVSLCSAFESDVAPRVRRVANGEQSNAGQWPWLVSLHIKMRRGRDEFLCGATLINEWTLVTGKLIVIHNY